MALHAGGGAIPVDQISGLPDDLRRRILTHLSLKEAIRTSVLARGWHDLWKTRWSERCSVEIHRLRSSREKKRKLDDLEKDPRRFDSFSITVDISKLKSTEFQSFVDYAAKCLVGDLQVEILNNTVANKLNFHLPRSSPLLERLSLSRISIANKHFKDAKPFHALEIIRLHTVRISVFTFKKIVALCPNLRTLELLICDCDDYFPIGKPMASLTNLRSLTVAECRGRTSLGAVAMPSLRSFRYRGGFLEAPFYLPRNAPLADLYIWFGSSISGIYANTFNEALPNDLSGLTVLTICSNALPAAFPLSYGGATSRLSKLSILRNLKELQLLMLKMAVANLSDIYVFLKNCQCANLERLFLQLPDLKPNPIAASLDVVVQEPPEVRLEKLKMVKCVNFNWHRTNRIDVQLVRFLLRKATSLQKVLLVSSNINLLDMSSVQEEDRLLLAEVRDNDKVILSMSDDGATQPYHSEVFIKV